MMQADRMIDGLAEPFDHGDFAPGIYGGANPDLAKTWAVRGALMVLMIIGYAVCRSKWHVEEQKA